MVALLCAAMAAGRIAFILRNLMNRTVQERITTLVRNHSNRDPLYGAGVINLASAFSFFLLVQFFSGSYSNTNQQTSHSATTQPCPNSPAVTAQPAPSTTALPPVVLKPSTACLRTSPNPHLAHLPEASSLYSPTLLGGSCPTAAS